MKKLLGESNKKRLEKKRNLLMKKLANIHVVNLASEDLDNAQDLLGIKVVPIEFEIYVVEKEDFHCKYIDKELRKEMMDYGELNQIPIRTVYSTLISGIDDVQNLKDLLAVKYSKGSFFIPDMFLSPAYIDALLGKDIVLLGICKIAGVSNQIQVLLTAYELQTNRKYKRPEPTLKINPQGVLVRWKYSNSLYPGFYLGFFILWNKIEHLSKKSAIFSCIF